MLGWSRMTPRAESNEESVITLDTWLASPESDVESSRHVLVPALTILYHPDIERIGAQALLPELASGEPAFLSRIGPGFSSHSRAAAEPLADRALSRSPLRFTALPDRGVRIDADDCRTRVVVDGEPLQRSVELSAHALLRGVTLELAGRIVLLAHTAAAAVTTAAGFATVADDAVGAELIGHSTPIRRLRHAIRRVADLDVPVLIRGETGSGKELAARAIHRASPRRGGPFVAVNLAAIPGSLASSELFGADRGAFTGAVRRHTGYFARAEGGTLFLDEIAEAPHMVQVALLRALETGEIQPVGAERPSRVDVRILAATDADLEAKIEEGAFRAPLLHRLTAYELSVPPLRERRDDIGRLLIQFLAEELARVGEAHRLTSPPPSGEPWLPTSLVARLAAHSWPGNVRQLRNVARQLVIGNRGRRRVASDPVIERLLGGADPKAPEKSAPPAAPPEAPNSSPSATRAKAAPSERRKPGEISEEELASALRATRWDIASAASLLRISRTSLYTLIEEHPHFRTAGDLPHEEITRAYDACGGSVERMVERLEVSERALRRRMRELGLEEREA